MNAPNHDTLVRRLALILVKLNQGEKLNPVLLAEEFGVNLRTIQRDLNERFAYLPLEKANGLYELNPVFLGKLSSRDVAQFAGLAGVRGLFPSLSDDFLRDIFDTRIQSALLVKGQHYEDRRHDEWRQHVGRRLDGWIRWLLGAGPAGRRDRPHRLGRPAKAQVVQRSGFRLAEVTDERT